MPARPPTRCINRRRNADGLIVFRVGKPVKLATLAPVEPSKSAPPAPHACSCGEPRGKSLAKFQRAGEAAAIRPSEAAYQAWGQSRTHLMRNVNDAFVVAANSNGIRAEFVPLGDGMPRLPRPRKPPGRASRLQVRGPTGRQRRSLLTRLRDAAREENRFHQCARRR
jgi:hypothetical protein